MRQISAAEMLQLREILQMETNALAVAKATQPLVEDDELKTMVKSGIQAGEARVKNLQQFLNENGIVSPEVQ